MSLDLNKGPGPDGLPPCMLVNCASTLLLPLTMLYNCSLSTGTFPELWKRSFLVPVFKSGARNKVENYRGIAIISSIPKLFEKLVLDVMELTVISRLNDEKHGFVKGRSTVTNLVLYSSFLVNGIEGGGQVDSIYTDFSRAFDRVNHHLLLLKLERHGLRVHYFAGSILI